MATNTSIKVATNTGAAKDDVLTSLLTGLTEDNRIASLNVLANDPGAARLYSLAQNVSGTSSSTFPVAGQGLSALGATLSMNADGTVKYDASSVNLQYLAAGQKITDTFTYTVRMANGAVSTASVTVDLLGQNDGPVITNAVAATRGSVTEDVALTATGQLSASDVDNGATQAWSIVGSAAGTYGALALNAATGQWVYSLNNAANQALAAGESHTETFTVRVTDDQGAFVNQQVSVVVNGTNDGPVVTNGTAATKGSVTEDTALTATGQLGASDVDNGATQAWSIVGSAAGTYGALAVNAATGQWTYSLNNTANQALAAGQSHTEIFTVRVADDQGAFVNQQVSVVVNGTNDGPVVTNGAAATQGSVTEDAALTATGQLGASDVDNGATQTWSLQGSNAGAYGNLTVNATGVWSYALNNASANVQALAAGQQASDSFTVRVTDDKGAFVDQVVNVAITGTNDAASISGNSTGAVTEDATVSTSGTLAVADVDQGQAVFQAQTNAAGTYGSFSIAADGNWTYALNNGAANVQALAAGQQASDSFTVVSQDGTASQVVNVAITGTNDAPVVQGTQTEQLYTSSLSVWTPFLQNNGVWVTPDGASSGDTAPHTFVRQFTAAQDGNYRFEFAVDNEGTVAVDGVAISGLYNNDWSHSTVQTVALTAGIHTVTMNALNWGGPAAFAMNITDPNNIEIWNTRTHLDPEPLISSYTENQAAMVVSANLTLTDVDSLQMSSATVSMGAGFAAGQDILGFANQNGITGTYDAATGVLNLNGSATVAQYQTALRSVTYSNSSDSPSTAERTINFVANDGASHDNLSNTAVAKILVTAVNDVASISGTSTGAVQEDTTLSTSGTLAVADVDQGQAVFQAQTNAAGTYGSFSIGANGNWTYALNNGAANVQALNTSDHLSDSFTVLSQDGTASQLVTVNVNGLDDNQAPVAVNDLVEGSVTQVVSALTFEEGTYSQSYSYNYNTGNYDYTISTEGFSFTADTNTNNSYGSGPYITNYWGADYSNTLYSYGYGGYYYGGTSTTTPIAMMHADGSSFSLASANITSYQDYYSYGGTGYETVTGYSNGVQVAQQSFYVPNANNGSHNNVVTFTDPGFNSVDKVVFSLTNSGGSYYYYYNYAYQWIDNVGVNASAVASQTEDRTVDINVLGNDTDADVGDTLSVASFAALSAQGAAITLNTDGTLHYDPTQAANLQALAAGETLTDTFTYTSQDQHGAVSNTATVSVVLRGTNDAASISGVSTGFVTEDVTLQTTGQLVVSDVDHGEALVRAQSNIAGNYGSFSIAADGNWTYALSNGASNVQTLGQSQHVSDSFTVTSADGTATQQVSVDIAGSNDAPVAANDTISGGFLTFENGTYSQNYGQYNPNTGNYDYTVTTGDFVFTNDSSANNGYGSGPYVTGGYWGADYSSALYSYGYGGYYYSNSSATTTPIAMTHVDGSSFSLSSANITSYLDSYYGYGGAGYETVTGYSNGVQVAQQSFYVPDAYNDGNHNNVVTFTDPGFSSVDKVVFSLSNTASNNYYYYYNYAYQWIDNIALPNTVAQSRDVNVLANDSDIDGGSYLSVGSFSGFSAHGAAISLNADGTLRYDPTVSAELQALSQGTNVYDSFTYQAQDEFGALSNLATVGINVVGVAHTV